MGEPPVVEVDEARQTDGTAEPEIGEVEAQVAGAIAHQICGRGERRRAGDVELPM